MTMKRPPVEPLSRPAWDRVEAGVFARLDRGDHLIASVDGSPTQFSTRALHSRLLQNRRWVMAGALAAAASVALWWRLDPADDVAPLAQEAVPAAPIAAAPEVARQQARIVSSEAPTETTLGEAVITLAAHSDVNVAGSDAEGWLVQLEAGRVDCKVAPRHGRPPFVVQAGLTKVSVVGTRFAVARAGAEASVSVSEGHVQVDSGDAHVLLGPGEAWPRAEGAIEEAAPAEADGADDAARAKPSVVVLRAQQRFERAARLEAKDPVAALAIYQQLARGKGPWAANALYAQARLELERGRPQRAEPLLRRYLERHPQGLNAADVRKLLGRIEKTQ
jgi:ferric-dicitrate binding protein FerR (iron transport regulator)